MSDRAGERLVTAEDVRACLSVLEALARDRGPIFSALSEDERVAFLKAAGKIATPTKLEAKKLSRHHRKERRRERRERDQAVREGSGIREARKPTVFVAPPRLEGPSSERELETPLNCYVCKKEYRKVHFFYDSMCPPCAELNYAKRFQTAPLDGRVALVTGARVKIGHHCALKLLRAGARVLATTRFPNDAARRYAREPDFAEWRDRLQIFGLDLRHAPSVELLATRLASSLDRLDFIINNACQTVRRPPQFYAHLIEHELRASRELHEDERLLLRDYDAIKRDAETPLLRAGDPTTALAKPSASSPVGLLAPARLSQLHAAFDGEDGFREFPKDALDVDLQQVDLRDKNSWRLRLAEVETWELLEVHLVNAVAPFIFTSRLKPAMLKVPTRDKHVVQVSAMEGSFSRGTKTDRHPHTNMAKAALNMLVLTSAPDYARDGIHMNAVDTGWVTDEDPALHATRKRDELGFQPPLDIVDGAARVCDPIFSGFITGEHVSGKFLKDYKPTSW